MSTVTGTGAPPVDPTITDDTETPEQEGSGKVKAGEILDTGGEILGGVQNVAGSIGSLAEGGVEEPGTEFVPEQPTLEKLAKQQQERPDVALPPDVQARRDQLCEKLGLPASASNREIEIVLRQEKQKMEIGGKYKSRSTSLDGDFNSPRNRKLEGLLAEKQARAEADGTVAASEEGAEKASEPEQAVSLTDARRTQEEKETTEEKDATEEQNQADIEQQLAAQLSDRDKIKTV
jgi:hypothetical protein